MKTILKRRHVRGLYSPELLESRIAPATFTVTNLNDLGDGSLRKAVADANATSAPDTIVFAPTVVGTITLASEIVINTSMTIKGPGAGRVNVSGNNASRIFNIGDGDTGVSKTVAIGGLSLINGSTTGEGGAIINTETLTLQNMVLALNHADNDGGAIKSAANGTGVAKLSVLTSKIVGNTSGSGGGGLYAFMNGDIKIIGSLISGNTAAAAAGGLYASIVNGSSSVGNILIQSTTISGNTTTAGNAGGAYLDNPRTGGKVSVVASIVTGNSAPAGNGGGLYLDEGLITITGTTFSRNTAVQGGGLFDALTDGLTITASRFINNVATGATDGGGGMLTTGDHPVKIVNTLFSGNSAEQNGGGLSVVSNAKVTLQGTAFVGNRSVNLSGIGGGLFASFGTVKITGGAFTENSSGDDGGGIGVLSGSVVNLEATGTNFVRNYAGNDGAGIRFANAGGTLKLTTVTMADNVSEAAGGGLYANGTSTATITSSKFLRNSALGGNGGGLYLRSGLATIITGTKIADNYSKFGGGGVFIVGAASTLTIKASKITGNVALTEGGGVKNTTGVAVILNGAIITGNTAPVDPDKSGLFSP